MSWAERAADRSPSVQRSRSRIMAQAQQILDAARRLIAVDGADFTTQELAREAGVALQTFYRYFTGKDQLLLAVIEDMMTESAGQYAAAAREMPDPISRMHYYVSAALSPLEFQAGGAIGARFVTAQHWRLHQLFPAEMARATQPYTDLIAAEIREAQAAGALQVTDVERAAGSVARHVMATFHYYAFAAHDTGIEQIIEQAWTFCLHGVSVPAVIVPPRQPALVLRTERQAG